jgi:hypothetical protein
MAHRACVRGRATGHKLACGGAAVLALLLPGCAADGEAGQVASTTVTTVVTAEPSSTPSGTATSGSAATTTSSAPLTSSPGTSVETPPTDQPLTLEDFFNPDDGWQANRYDIAGRSDVQGIATTVASCYESSARVLELRLSNKFSTLTFAAGQADNSASSDQRLTVEILTNNEQAEIRAVPFNQVQDFTIPVEAVNAVKFRLYLDPDSPRCGGSVVGVLHDIRVS